LSKWSYLTLLASALAFAQSGSRPTFEVASVKASQSAEPARLTSNPGTWSCVNCRLFDLFGHAFKVFEYQIVAPDWTKGLNVDVVAKLPPGVRPAAFAVKVEDDPFALMLQNLLEDRFKMAAHREQRDTPVYELVIAKGGPKLKEVAEPEPPPPPGPALDQHGFPNIPGGTGMRILADRGRIQFRRQAMVHIAHFISTQVDRPVVDATGLKGQYALQLSWFKERPGADALPGPTIFQAVQDQLGLKLQPAKAKIDVVVIDRVERKPLEN
jgi:uncharacterized protein (TIGR03435 family)